jgi:molybdate transport system ATP-binding protein
VQTEFGIPTLFVSHSLPEILQLTTRVAVLDRGAVLGQGELNDVLGRDEVFRLADALGLESLVEVEVLGNDDDVTRVRLGGHAVSLPRTDRAAGTRALVAVRPEDVVLARGPVEGISAQNAMKGTVTQVTRLSDRVLVSVDVGATLRAEITTRSERELGIAPGAPIWCLVKVFSFRWRRFLDS